MLKIVKGKFPAKRDFFIRLKNKSKETDTIVWTGDKSIHPIYRLSTNQDGALSALAIIGSMIVNGEKIFAEGKQQYCNVHVWRFVDSCERCNGGKSVYGIQFNTPHALYYFLYLGFNMFSKDELVQELTYSILKDLGY